LAFAQAGANVMITARTEKDVSQTAEECKKFGNKVGKCVADGMKLSDLENLVKEVFNPISLAIDDRLRNN
jgi:short-subunit dehydrogenase